MNSDELRLRVECYVAIRRALGRLVVRSELPMLRSGFRILNLFTAFCQASSGTDARSGVQAETIWDA